MSIVNRSGRRPARWAAVAAVAVAAVVGTPMAALAEPDRLLELSEQGGDTVVPVHFDDIVPGDSEEFTLDIRNAGPTSGVLVVDLPEPYLKGDTARQFYDELTIEGPNLRPTSVRDLAPRTFLFATVLESGDQVSVPLRFVFPETSVGGNDALEGEHEATIYVHAQIYGDLEAAKACVPQGSDTTNAGSAAGGGYIDSGGSVPRTGADLGLLGIAAAITAVGLGLWALATRRKRQGDEQ